MTPDFPHNINKIDPINFLLLPDVAKSLPSWLSQFRKAELRQPTGQRLSNSRKQQTKISIGPILFFYYEESLVSSNLNQKIFRFHCVRPGNALEWVQRVHKPADLWDITFCTL